jgi:hypothetical protein
MGISNPDSSATTRRLAWLGLLLLSATLSAGAWFGTYHQSLTEQHAYARCASTAGSCARPESSPVWAFGGVAVALILLAGWVAVRGRTLRIHDGAMLRKPVSTP